MSWFSKVAWKEGLFLQPHHLQQSDRYLENLIQARTRVITPYPWGVIEMVMDRDQAQQGRIALRSISGMMPDGTPFDAPGTAPLPLPIDVPEDGAGMFIWLTLPDTSPNNRDAAPYDDEGSATRWGIVAETVSDSASALRSEQVLELAVPRLELAVRKTPRPGYQNLRLARITEVRDG
ncbi:type VI secretion system baseplate subunit TssK, partial [Paracoccus sp. (in: a-proteobacteria)]|uniref:type VI secretion system baseplate subunit TssK n=1 Tax=Paracoccus sp. TaxID=267 RepID=UPI0028976BFF